MADFNLIVEIERAVTTGLNDLADALRFVISGSPRTDIISAQESLKLIDVFMDELTRNLGNIAAARVETAADRAITDLARLGATTVTTLGAQTQSVVASQSQLALVLADTLRQVMTEGLEVINLTGDVLLDTSTRVLNSVADLESDLAVFTLNAIEDTAGTAISAVSELGFDANLALQDVADSVLKSISDSVVSSATAITTVTANALQLANDSSFELSKLIDATVLTGNATIAATNSGFSGLTGAIGAIAGPLINGLQELVSGPLGEIDARLGKFLVDVITDGAKSSDDLLFEMSGSPLETHPQTRGAYRTVRDTVAQLPGGNTLGNYLFSALASVLLLWLQTQTLAAVENENVERNIRRANPDVPLSPSEALQASIRQLISDDQLADDLAVAGFNEERQTALRGLVERLPEPERHLQHFYRGFIDESELLTELERLGFTEDTAQHIRQAGDIIPPVQDLITMAVREVFTPDIAAAFGQFEDFPEPLAEFAAQQGLTREWAERFWAAHWRLPSAQQGFEMLHRGVIDESDVSLLLRSLDVMPFWRERLTAIAFNNLTRVDVRRMHRTGVITTDEVKRAYLDLGYNELNAERLTAFTEELTATGDDDESQTLKEATRSTIIRAYGRGIITQESARQLLIDANYSDEAADLFIALEDLRLDFQARDDIVDTIEVQFKAGIITFDKAQDQLASAGLETIEQTQAVARLIREQARQVRQPSRADLDKFKKAGIIEDGIYLAQMKVLGYSDEWAGRFLQLLSGEGE